MNRFRGFYEMKKNKSIRFMWFLSYFIVVSILLCALAATYLSYDKILFNETMQFNEYAFEKVSDSVRNNMSSVNMIYQKMYDNSTLNYLSTVNDAEQYYKSGHMQKIINDISLYSDTIYGIDLMYFYLPKTDYVISKHGILLSSDFYRLYFDESVVDYDMWKTELSDIADRKYRMGKYKGEIKQKEAMEYIVPIQFENSQVTMVIMTDKTKFLSGVDKIKWINMCDMYIYGPHGKLIMAEVKSNTEKELPMYLSRFKQNNIDNVIYITSNTTEDKWVLATVIPKSTIIRKTLILRVTILSAVSVCLIIVGIFIFFFANKNYKPIKNIFEITNIDENIEHYDKLCDELKAIMADKRKMKISLDKKNIKLSKFELSRVIHGDMSSYFMNDSDSIIDFSEDYFAVLIFYLENIDELFENEKVQISNSERKVRLGVIVENIISELYERIGFKAYFSEIDNNIVCLVNIKDKKNGSNQDFIEIAKLGTELINKNFDISLIYTSSNILEGVVNISMAYNQALDTLKFVILYGINESMCYSENIQSDSIVEIFNLNRQQNLINSLKTGNEKNANNIVEYVFSYINQNKNISPEHITIIIHDIINTIVKCVAELLENGYKINIDMSLYNDIRDIKPIGEIKNKITGYIGHICFKVAEYEKEKKSVDIQISRVNNIVNFINENYTNPVININYLAKTFNLGPAYLSRLFKEATGEKMMDYLNGMRVKEAKRLIGETEDSLEVIAAKAGFNHIRTFYRVYKKFEGINPMR